MAATGGHPQGQDTECGREGTRQALQGRTGHPRRQSRGEELWERGSSHLRPWKLSRVLTEPELRIKITAIQRGALALSGVSQKWPPASEFPLDQSPRDCGEDFCVLTRPTGTPTSNAEPLGVPAVSLRLVTPPYMTISQLQKARLQRCQNTLTLDSYSRQSDSED